MGRIERSGYGYGMNEYEAKRDFSESLNQEYGEGLYQGGGNDIREWLQVKCLKQPIPASAPNKTKSVKVAPKADGKLVNGFIVTTETPTLIRRQASASFTHDSVPPVVEEYALTQGDAKKKADALAKKHNTEVHVIPDRLWQENRTNRLSAPARILEVTPAGGKEAVPGKWSFTVEVAF